MEYSLNLALSFINDPALPWWLAIGILSLAFLLWLRFSFAVRRVSKQLTEGQLLFKEISAQQFAQNYSKFNEQLSQHLLLGNSWRAFKQTLISTEQDIYYTVRPAQYFNETTIVASQVNLRLYQAVPNMLVGIGIWFTFIGLVAALWFASKGVAAPDIVQAQLSLQDLLHAATFKFVTSIAGLFGSLLFSWAEKSKLYQLHRQLNHFCQTVESCLILHTPLQQEVNLLNEIRMQTYCLKNLPQTLLQTMQPVVSKMDHLLEKSDHTQVLERLLNDFSRQVQGAAGTELKQLASTLQQLTLALGDLPQRFNDTGQRLQLTQQEVGELNNEIVQQLRHTALELRESTQHFYVVAAPLANAVETFQTMLARLENLTQTLNGFEQSHVRALQSMENTSKNMGLAWESYQNRFEKVDEDVAHIFQQLSKGLDEYRRQVEHFTGGLDSSMNTAVQSLNQVIAELVEALEDWHQQNSRQRKN
jgi:methyl-accepting chemotaxis protein